MLHLFIERENQPKRPRSEWTESEKLELTRLVYEYLKRDPERDIMSEKKRTLELDGGRQIQYVDYYVSHSYGDVDYGFEDTIVFVGQSVTSADPNETPKKCFLGTGWESIDRRFMILDMLSERTLEEVAFAVAMHEGLNPHLRV